jgi:subtilisin family serine protease
MKRSPHIRGVLPIGAMLVLTGVCFLVGVDSIQAETNPAWRDKIHPKIWESVGEEPGEFILFLTDQARPETPAALRSKRERVRYVSDLLRAHAQRTQAPLLSLLDRRAVAYRSYWIANMIWVRGDQDLLERLARRPEVLRVDANPRVRMQPPVPAESETGIKSATGIEWNLTLVGADGVWSQGYLGGGVVVGGQDTGYQWDHPALVGKYRGWNGVGAVHDHNWHDAIHSGGGVCGADAQAPCDDHGHGTHTMGTMIGDDGGVNQIGMAPEAKWIGCRNMDQGVGTPQTYTECFQWFVAPTDLNGENADPDLAPDVINNSWVCPPFEGCSTDTLRTIVENTRAAGIVVVVSAGNAGPVCGSVEDPPAIYDAAFSVGATSSADSIASFSSRGPVTIDGSNRLKPDISAPGVSVRSSAPTDGYTSLSGTSMAAPHVVGLVALLLSARPDLKGRIDEIESLVESSAVQLTTIDGCGGDTVTTVPNHTFGHGRIDAEAILTADADGDAFDNLSDCLPVDATVWSEPSPARELLLNRDAGGTLSWQQPTNAGTEILSYDVLRSDRPDDFSGSACVATNLSLTTTVDSSVPTETLYYLVRSSNACAENLGQTSDGVPRDGPFCP